MSSRRGFVSLFVFVLAVFSAFTASAQIGALDNAFGTSGKTLTNFGTVTGVTANGRGVVVQPSGRIVVGGGSVDGLFLHLCVVGLQTDGKLDTSFGTNGVTRLNLATQDQINAVALTPDNKIVVVGYTNASTIEQFLIARFTTDGQFDPTFNSGGTPGYLVTSIAGGANGQDRGMDVAVQADGKIIAAGWGRVTTSVSPSMVACRLNTDGSFDQTFGTGGKITFDPGVTGGSRSWSVTIQPDQKIVLGGNVGGTSSQGFLIARFTTAGALDTTFGNHAASGATVGYVTESGTMLNVGGLGTDDPGTGVRIYAVDRQNGACSVARYNLDGTRDGAWGSGGVATPPSGGTCETVGFQADHKVVIGGTLNGSPLKFLIQRLNSNGSTDSTFNGTGYRATDTTNGSGDNQGLDMKVLADGTIIQAGEAVSASLGLMEVARYTSTGALDTANFASPTGYMAVTSITGGTYDEANGMAIDSLGRILLAGTTNLGTQDFAVARYSSAGVLDTTYDTDGKNTADFGQNEYGFAAAVQSDDKLVVVGDSEGPTTNWAIARFTTAGALDTTFNSTGKVLTSFGNGAAKAVTIQSDGKILVAGSASVGGTTSNFGLARYTTGGALDAAFGSGGLVNVAAGGVAELRGVAVQPDGKIVVAGKHTSGNDAFIDVMRFTSAGVADATFGTSGRTSVQISTVSPILDEGYAVFVQPDGRILVAGRTGTADSNSRTQYAVIRFNSNGTLDTTFGTNGKVSTAFGVNNQDQILSLMLQADEKIVAFGSSQVIFTGVPQYAIARYNWDDGSLDTSFGNSGMITFPIRYNVSGNVTGYVYKTGALAGKMHMTGSTLQGDFTITRHTGDTAAVALSGAPDMTAATDSGRFSNDNITNVKRPTFTGSPCTFENSVFFLVDGSLTSPRSGQVCKSSPTGSYTATLAVDLADGVHTVSAYSATGFNQTTPTATVTFTIDTVALPPTITTPAAAASQDVEAVSFSGNGAEAAADVTVREGATTLCVARADGAGSWTCSPSTLMALGSHTITAYQVDIAGNQSNDSTAVNFFVKAQTTTAITSNHNPSVFGQNVTFTSTVTSLHGTPDASVGFVIDGGAPANVTLVSGVGTLSRANLSVANHPVVANYNGSSKFFTSNATLTNGQTVNKADTSTAVTSSANPSVFGQNVTLTFVVSAVLPGAGTPTGTLNLTIDGGAAIPLTLAGGTVTYSTAALSAATHTVSVAYVGDGNFNSSNGSLAAGQVVNKANTTTALTSSVNPSNFGQSVTFTATVSITSPGAGTLSGTVTFLDGVTAIGTIALTGNTAALTTTALSPATHGITAHYDGDASFNTSTSTAVSQVVNKINTTTALTQSSATSTFGESVTLTATVNPALASPNTPSGTITFKSGTTSVGTAVLDGSGVATLTTTTLAVNPTHSLTAVFAGDSFFNASTSSAITHAVTAANTTLSLSSSVPSSSFGQSVTFTATMSVTAPGAGVATGTIAFSDGATSIGNVPLTGGIATLSVSNLNAGSHTINATYGGDGNFNSSSGSTSQSVTQGDSTLVLTSSANPSPLGQPFSLIATITPLPPAAGVPSGNVQFKEGSTTIGTSALDASGVAMLPVNSASIGQHSYIAIYIGSANYFATASGPFNETVTPALSTTALTSSVNPAVYGQSTTLTATVTGNATGGTPSGTVAFFDGANSIGSIAVDGSGVAALTLNTLSVGPHALTAQYGGSALYQPSGSSPALSQLVNPAATTTTVSASTSAAKIGQTVTFTATVTVNAPGSGTPTGTVTFKNGAATLGSGAVNGSGVATLATATLPAGSYNVTAVYGGDSNDNTSTSTAAALTVDKGDTSVVATTSGPTVFGQSVTFTATVSVTAPAAGTPGGTVTFNDGATLLGSGAVNAAGVASFTTTSLSVASHTITASYGGDSNFNGANNTVAQLVNQASTSTTLTSNNNPAKAGQSVILTATVTVNAPGSGIPSGTVTFLDGVATLGTGALNASGVATFTTTTLGAGTHTITATYGGDSSFSVSTSASLGETVTTNHAPVLVPVGNKVTRAQTLLSFVITATDSDGDAVTYSATGLPATATLDPASGAFNWTPAVTDLGSHTVTFIATDPSSATASETITISVVRNFVRSDFDGDSLGDLAYQRASDGRVVEWRNGGLTTVSTPGPQWVVVGTGDFNLDGRADMVMQNGTTGDVVEWQMNGDTVTAGQIIGSPAAGWKVVALGDVNGDGRDDVVLQNTTTGDVAVWLVNGMSITGGAVVGTPGTAWKAKTAADVDGDGRADIVLQNTTTGDVAVWLMNGLTLMNGKSVGTPGPGWKVTATGDVNGDGSEDLVLQNSGSGDVVVWEMNGGAIAAGGVIGSPGTGWSSITTTDLNGDGKADLILQNSAGPVALWQMNGLTLTGGTLLTAPGSPWIVVGAAP